jgi:AcrR family transcriptional regulator
MLLTTSAVQTGRNKDSSAVPGRLVEAMVRVAAADGYGDATVSKVIAEAGVSRATFYDHFDNRAECFAAAYRQTIGRMRSAIFGAMRRTERSERPRIVVEALLRAAADDPAGARFVLIEALGEHEEVRATHEKLIAEVDSALSGHLAGQSNRSPQLQIPAVALRAGIAGVIVIRICRGEAGTLPDLCDDLSRWIDSYRLPTGVNPLSQEDWARLGRFMFRERAAQNERQSLLPRGRSSLPATAAAAARRGRIVEATARMTAARGYPAMTVSDIVASARVTRAVFYSHFRSKKEAFLAAQTAVLQEAVAAVASEFSLPASWPERVWAAGETFLRFVAHNPDLAYLDFVAANAAGPEAIRHRHQNYMAFSLFLEDGYRQSLDAKPPPRVTTEAVGAALFGSLRQYVVRGRTAELPSLLPTLVYLALTPFLGPRRAMEFIEDRLQAGR